MYWIIPAVLAVFCLIFVLTVYLCYRMAFRARPQKPLPEDAVDIPEGEIYEVYRPQFETWAREMRALPCKKYQIRSFDGLRLCGKFYEYAPDAPIELMFHGYRGTAERDLSGGVQRCFRLGHSALIVDQRCSGESEGRSITFGIKEHRDCHAWLRFMQEEFGTEIPIILTGISMGASTVMMAAGKPLPKNVVGVLADCGFTSAKEIIQKVIGQMGLPVKPAYFFVKLAAKWIGGFDLEETSAIEAMRVCPVPVIFFHGEADDFVPCDMSRKNYEACTAKKKLVTVPGAGHGLAFPAAQAEYLKAMQDFFGF